MKVKKELYFESPFPGVAVYAHHQCYTASSGNDIIEAVRYEARNEKRESHGGAAYYGREMYRRISYDNGKNWEVPGYICYEDPLDKIEEHPFMYQHFRDHRNNMLVSIHETKKYDSTADKGHERFSDEGITTKRRLYYQISADKGRTWSKPERIIAKGAGFDDIHWGPGLYYGKNGGGGDLATTTALPGGTFCFGGTFNLEDGKKYQAALLHGRWLEGLSGIEWEFSDYITTRADQSS
jgi:hypothetical protein